MNVPKELMYTKSHEWVKTVDETTVVVGLTDYAQDALGDLVFVNLPEPGDDVTAGEAFGDVESVKAVSDVLSPVTGQVEEINEELLDSPESVNQSPYDAWFVKIKDISGKEELMDGEAYERHIWKRCRHLEKEVDPWVLMYPIRVKSSGKCSGKSALTVLRRCFPIYPRMSV